AIVVGNGIKGWQEISKNGDLDKDVRELLDAHFVCVYLDSSTDSGKKMANALAVGSGPALIIGDRSGTNQAFRYKGSLTTRQLTDTLKRFSKVGEVATATESSVTASTPSSAAQTPNYPSYYAP